MTGLLAALMISSAMAWEYSSDADRMTDVGSHYAIAETTRGAMVVLNCTTERPEAMLTVVMPSGTIVDAEREAGGRVASVRYRGTGKAETAAKLYVAPSLTVIVDGGRVLLGLAVASPSDSALIELPTYRLGGVVHEFDSTGIAAALATIEAKCAGGVTP